MADKDCLFSLGYYKMRNFLKWFLVLTVIFIVFGCGGNKSSDKGTTIIDSDVIVYESNDSKDIILSNIDTEDNINLKVTNKMVIASLKMGDIFYATPQNNMPFGIVGKVENIDEKNVVLSPVNYADIIQESKLEKTVTELNSDNFIGVIAPSFIGSSLNKQQKKMLKNNPNIKSYLNGAVVFSTNKSERKSQKISEKSEIPLGKIDLNLKLDLHKIATMASLDNNEDINSEAELIISGSLTDLKLYKEHDISIRDRDLSFNMTTQGTMNAEVKLEGEKKITWGYYSKAWQEVEENTYELGLSAKLLGLESKDKRGKYPIVGLVFRTPSPEKYFGETQRPLRNAKSGGVIIWVYLNAKGELKLNGSLGMGVHSNFKIGVDKPKDKGLKFIKNITEVPNRRFMEAPFIDGKLIDKLTLGLSIEADFLAFGIRIANAGADFKYEARTSIETDGRASYGLDSPTSSWSWSGAKICVDGRSGAGVIFSADIKLGIEIDAGIFEPKGNIEYSIQYPTQYALDNTDTVGRIGTWYNIGARTACYNQESTTENISSGNEEQTNNIVHTSSSVRYDGILFNEEETDNIVHEEIIDEVNLPKPTLKSPGSSSSPGDVLTNTTQTLEWYATKNATYYWVAVRDVDTGKLVYNEEYITGTSVTINTLTPGHKYFWDIQACNSVGCSASRSDSLYFQIKDNESDDTLQLNTPISTCNGDKPEISLSWNDINNVSKYKIHSNRIFPSGEYFKNVPNQQNSIVLSDELQSNYSYRFYIRAEMLNGDIIKSNEVNINTKDCDHTNSSSGSPDKPDLLSPGLRHRPYPEIQNTDITLQWSLVDEATYYRLNLFDLNTNREIFSNKKINTNRYYAKNDLRVGHKYFWEVSACNDNGCSSEQRVYFIIKGEVVPPEKPTGLSPGSRSSSNPTLIDNIQVTLRWNSADHTTYYKVNVVKGALKRSGPIVVKDAITTDTSYVLNNLERGKKYYWWVEAVNDDRRTESDYYGFKIEKDTSIPTISSISPSPITKSSSFQDIYINGSNFNNQSRVEWKTSYGSSGTVSSANTHYQNSSRIKIHIRVNGNSNTWYFRVKNSNGYKSDWISVSVKDNTSHCALDNFTNHRLSETFNYGDKDINRGGTKTQVKELQKFLNELGYNAGTADGIYGDNTYYAVKRYQRDNGLDDDGLVGPITKESINNTSCN